MRELRCGGVAVWGSFSVGEFQCWGVAVLGRCGVGELPWRSVAVWGSCNIGELQCWGVVVWGSHLVELQKHFQSRSNSNFDSTVFEFTSERYFSRKFFHTKINPDHSRFPTQINFLTAPQAKIGNP